MQRRVPHIHERFLRHIWNRQYLRHASLATTTGLPITVLHPGTLNSASGPDFVDARIIIGRTTYTGDVEIHRNPVEWLQHHHQHDPRYNRVILHVVLEEGGEEARRTFSQSGRAIPVLVLEKFLAESLRSLWHRSILDERTHAGGTIPCATANNSVPAEILSAWLEKLSVERLELKLRRFDERLRQLAQEEMLAMYEPWRRYGEIPVEGYPEEIPPPSLEPTTAEFSRRDLWDQILYEGIMDALGFSRNRDPFVKLAQRVPLKRISELGLAGDRLQCEALLFGAAGLLPDQVQLSDPITHHYIGTLQDGWKNLRQRIQSGLLQRADWVFFPTRPLNFPTVRLAVGAAFVQEILTNDLFRRIIQTFKNTLPPAELHRALLALLTVKPSDFWTCHYTFEQSSAKQFRALGKGRMRDIIINTLLPIALLYARIFHERIIREQALALYGWFPPLSDNAIVKTMEAQLVRGRIPVRSVQIQQGLIQLSRYYCLEGRCGECDIGKIVFKPSG
jgi:hypothetical protein